MMTGCPLCEWTTDELMSDPELSAVEGGADRLVLHLRVEHDAYPERDAEAWENGSWALTLYGVDLDDPGREPIPRLNLDERS